MLNTSECATGVDMACNTLYAYGEHLRSAAMSALDGCFPSGSCRDSIRSYLSMGAGDDGVPDSLIVVVGPMLPTQGSGLVGPTIMQVQFDIRLRESGYPMAQAVDGGRAIALPDPDGQHRATQQSLFHAGAIMARLLSMKSTGCLAPDGYRCTRGTISAVQPLPPQAGVTGWTISLTLQLPWA